MDKVWDREWLSEGLREGHIDLRGFCELAKCDFKENEETGFCEVKEHSPYLDYDLSQEWIGFIIDEDNNVVGICYYMDEQNSVFYEADKVVPFADLYEKDLWDETEFPGPILREDFGLNLSNRGTLEDYEKMKLEKVDGIQLKSDKQDRIENDTNTDWNDGADDCDEPDWADGMEDWNDGEDDDDWGDPIE